MKSSLKHGSGTITIKNLDLILFPNSDKKTYKNRNPTKMITTILSFSLPGPRIRSGTGTSPNLTSMEGKTKKAETSEKDISIVLFSLILVFIFDWDDTILCTSFLSSMQFLEINNDAKNLLKKLD